jgi:hypothetical protein
MQRAMIRRAILGVFFLIQVVAHAQDSLTVTLRFDTDSFSLTNEHKTQLLDVLGDGLGDTGMGND